MSRSLGAVCAEGVRKVYSNGVVALDGLDIDVPRGVIFSLLGRNGAGKTTFIRISSTQLMPTSGLITVLGFDAVKEADSVRGRIAVVPQEGRPASLNTPFEHIYHYLLARRMGTGEARLRARRTLEMLELEEYADTICSQLSGGLRQRTLVAMALSTDAELFFLDEPTIGLDAVTRLRIWDAIRRLTKREGRTVLLTTHYMEEAEALSDQIAVIDRGRIKAVGSVEDMWGLLKASMKVEVTDGGFTAEELECYGRVMRVGETYRIFLHAGFEKEIVEVAVRRGAKATVSRVTLEDVFISLVSGGPEGEGGGGGETGA